MIDLIVGGASKSGTTALFEMLKSSSSFFLPASKELHYFSLPFLMCRASGPGDRYVVSRIPASFSQYIENFIGKGANQISVDISPSYLFYAKAVDEIERQLPSVKVLFILRRPIEKIYSQYLHLVAEGREQLSFQDALNAEHRRKLEGYSDMFLYKESGFYAENIRAYIDKLGSERVKVVLFDKFSACPDDVLQEICTFVGLTIPQKFDTSVKANVSGAPKSRMLARLIGPNILTNAARAVIPHNLGLRMRGILRSLNSDKKPKLDHDQERSLLAVFENDIYDLESILGYKTGWIESDRENSR